MKGDIDSHEIVSTDQTQYSMFTEKVNSRFLSSRDMADDDDNLRESIYYSRRGSGIKENYPYH